MDTPRHRALGAAEDLRRVFVAEAVDADEDQRGAERVGQCIDTVAERDGELALLRGGRRISALAGPRLEEQRLDARIIRRGGVPARLAGAERVEREVHRDAVEPGEGLAPAIEPIEGLIGPDERLLRHVFCLRACAYEVEGEPENAPLVTPDQRSEGLTVGASGALGFGLINKLAIGRFGHP
jgi:hypothetical protein